jgi:hypothetical protein
VFEAHGGVEVDTEGDAFFVAFPDAAEALASAADAKEALASGPIRVRMGLHTGTPHLTDQGYVGVDVHKGARIAASGHGGQVILSRETRALLDDSVELMDLGEHRVKDFAEPVWIYQLGTERFPPLKTISNTNLPRPASSFVGREREVAEIGALLRDGSRLVTLTGPGGTGKTRLSIEAAAELVPDFKNGTYWVPLAALRDPALVPETIGQVIGAKDGLAGHIAEREMLRCSTTSNRSWPRHPSWPRSSRLAPTCDCWPQVGSACACAVRRSTPSRPSPSPRPSSCSRRDRGCPPTRRSRSSAAASTICPWRSSWRPPGPPS